MQIRIIAADMLAFFIFAACKKNEVFISSGDSEKLTGYWVNQKITDTLFTYDKSDNLVANDYGLAFLPGGKFIERKNSGFCGTPPIAYSDFEGNWSLNDSIVNISVGYWWGTVTSRWQVVSVSNERLIIEVISEEYSQEK